MHSKYFTDEGTPQPRVITSLLMCLFIKVLIQTTYQILCFGYSMCIYLISHLNKHCIFNFYIQFTFYFFYSYNFLSTFSRKLTSGSGKKPFYVFQTYQIIFSGFLFFLIKEYSFREVFQAHRKERENAEISHVLSASITFKPSTSNNDIQSLVVADKPTLTYHYYPNSRVCCQSHTQCATIFGLDKHIMSRICHCIIQIIVNCSKSLLCSIDLSFLSQPPSDHLTLESHILEVKCHLLPNTRLSFT